MLLIDYNIARIVIDCLKQAREYNLSFSILHALLQDYYMLNPILNGSGYT